METMFDFSTSVFAYIIIVSSIILIVSTFIFVFGFKRDNKDKSLVPAIILLGSLIIILGSAGIKNYMNEIDVMRNTKIDTYYLNEQEINPILINDFSAYDYTISGNACYLKEKNM